MNSENNKKRRQTNVSDDKKDTTVKKLKSTSAVVVTTATIDLKQYAEFVDFQKKKENGDWVVMSSDEHTRLQKLVDCGTTDTVAMDYEIFIKTRHASVKKAFERAYTWLDAKYIVDLVLEYDPFVPLVLSCALFGGYDIHNRVIYLTNFGPELRRFSLLELGLRTDGDLSAKLVVSDQTRQSFHGNGTMYYKFRLDWICVYDPTAKSRDELKWINPWIHLFHTTPESRYYADDELEMKGGTIVVPARYPTRDFHDADMNYVDLRAPALEKLHAELAELSDVWFRFNRNKKDGLCGASVRELFQMYANKTIRDEFHRILMVLERVRQGYRQRREPENGDLNILHDFYTKYYLNAHTLLGIGSDAIKPNDITESL